MFRLIIMQFMDAAGFDVRSVKKSCVHIVHAQIPVERDHRFHSIVIARSGMMIRRSGSFSQ